MRLDDEANLPEPWPRVVYDGEQLDLVFTTAHGTPTLRQHVDRAIRKAAERSGIDSAGLGTHAGRRSVVTNLFASGTVDLEDVARFVGHNDVATTRGYVQHEGDRPRQVSERALELLDPPSSASGSRSAGSQIGLQLLLIVSHLLRAPIYSFVMSNIVFFDDISDEVREAAEKFVAADHTEGAGVLAAMDDQPAVRELVLALAERLLRDLAAGRHPIYTTSEDEVSPAEAARILDVSRQYVDRLLADGRLPFGHKPGSTHRTICVVDVERLAAERSRRRTSTDAAITALIDGGLDY